MRYKGVRKARNSRELHFKSQVSVSREGSDGQRAQAHLDGDVNAVHFRLAEAIAHVEAENIACRLDAFMDALEVVNAAL